MNNYVIFGCPGSGKGTLSQFLCYKDEAFEQVCSGDLLRNEVQKGTSLGQEIDALIKNGKLVDEEIVSQLVISALEDFLKRNKRFTLDGFPQTPYQKKRFDRFVDANLSNSLKYVIIEINPLIALQRMVNRISCVNCSKIYNLEFLPPRVSGKCDFCFFPLKQRNSDKAELAKKRIDLYSDVTEKIVEHYKTEKQTIVFDGSRPLEDCFKDYTTILL